MCLLNAHAAPTLSRMNHLIICSMPGKVKETTFLVTMMIWNTKQEIIFLYLGAQHAVGGLELTAGQTQTARMNKCVLTRVLRLGAVYVRTITFTDVVHNGLRIPKEIVSVLNIPKTGNTLLTTGEDGNYYMESSYYMFTTMSCIMFLICSFCSIDDDGSLIISFDVL